MTTQLLLIDDSDHDWTLDSQTRELGRRGVAQARQVLHSVPRRETDHGAPSDTQHSVAA